MLESLFNIVAGLSATLLILPVLCISETCIETKIKVARVVNSKLVFTDKFFYNLVVLIKSCKIGYLILGRPLLFPRNQFFCVKN